MNVAICSSGDVFGGVERLIVALACRLNALAGHRARAILFSNGILCQQLREQGVETTIFEQPRYDPTVVARIARLFKAWYIQVAHTHGYKANLLCGAAARLAGSRVVKTEHGVELFTSFDRFKMSLNVGIDRFLSRYLVDRVVYVSKETQSRNEVRYGKLRGEVIYNGIPQPEPDSFQQAVTLDSACFNVGIVGRLTPVKGHIYLLQALNELPLPDLRLHVLGDGDLRSELERYSWEHGLSERVRFLGFRADADAYVRAFDALIMPSLSEGFPYTMLEAGYWGTPLIASGVGGIREVFSDGHDCLQVEPRNVSQLKDAIVRIYNDPGLRKTLGENARRNVMQNFLIDSTVRRYLAVYERSLNGRIQ